MRYGQRDARGYTLARAWDVLRQDPMEHLARVRACDGRSVSHGADCSCYYAACSCGWEAGEYPTKGAAQAAANRHAADC